MYASVYDMPLDFAIRTIGAEQFRKFLSEANMHPAFKAALLRSITSWSAKHAK